MDGQVKKTPVVLVLLAWLFVGLPWTWGVTQLWKNARKLFQSPPPVTTVAPAGYGPRQYTCTCDAKQVTERINVSCRIFRCHQSLHTRLYRPVCSARLSPRESATIY